MLWQVEWLSGTNYSTICYPSQYLLPWAQLQLSFQLAGYPCHVRVKLNEPVLPKITAQRVALHRVRAWSYTYFENILRELPCLIENAGF